MASSLGFTQSAHWIHVKWVRGDSVKRMPGSSRLLFVSSALAVFVFVVITLCAFAATDNSGRIHWKQLPDAQLKLDGKPPLTWNVYQPDKKKQSSLVLVLLGHRYLALDTKAKLVYVVFPNDLHAVGNDFETDDLMQDSRRIPSTEWIVRDVGPAESIKLTLGDYGRTLEVQLPHLPDLRGLY
jgi:hypothetical protein